MRIANEPIAWQKLSLFKQVDVVKTTSVSSKWASERGRKDIDMVNMVVGARRAADLNTWHTADLLGFSHQLTHLEGLQRISPRRGKYSVSERQLGEGKCLVEIRGQSCAEYVVFGTFIIRPSWDTFLLLLKKLIEENYLRLLSVE